MVATPQKYIRVLGLYPNQQGCAYAVLEGTTRLLSWGQLRLRQRTEEEFCGRLRNLLGRYALQTIAFEEANPRRSTYASTLIRVGETWSRDSGLTVVRVGAEATKRQVDLLVSATKRELVEQLIGRFPELKQCRPRTMLWVRDRRLDIFAAVSLCVGASAFHASRGARGDHLRDRAYRSESTSPLI